MMLTLTIDNPELERVFYEDFGGDNDSFVEFLSQNCCVNNVEYNTIDDETMVKLIQEGEDSGDSGMSHEEVFTYLREKYDINQI